MSKQLQIMDKEMLLHLYNAIASLNGGLEEMYKLTMQHNESIKELRERLDALEKKLTNP